jgi:FtsH-binding integral membrane protein
MGLSMASIFLVFTGTSIARTFFIAAAMFGATGLYGYTQPSAIYRSSALS